MTIMAEAGGRRLSATTALEEEAEIAEEIAHSGGAPDWCDQ